MEMQHQLLDKRIKELRDNIKKDLTELLRLTGEESEFLFKVSLK